MGKIKHTASMLLGLLLLLTYTGCGGTYQNVLSAQARVVMSTQQVRYDIYGEEHDRCLSESKDIVKYRDCMSMIRHVARAADAYSEALVAAQKAYSLKGARGIREHLACLAEAAHYLMRSMEVARIPVPKEVADVAGLLAEIGKGKCSE